MTSQVQLERTPLAHLLFALLVRRFDGVLTVHQPEPFAGDRHVWFAGGMAYSTDWVSQSDVLGEVLVERSWISAELVDEALLQMSRSASLMGQWMVANGHLSQAQVIEALRIQCERKLQRMFALRDGVVSLDAGEPATGTLPQINTLRVITLGVTSHYDAQLALTQLGALARGPVRASASFARYRSQFAWRPDDEAFLGQFVDGVDMRSLAAAASSSQRPLKIALVLAACQMLEVAEQVISPSVSPRPPPPPGVGSRPARPSSPSLGPAGIPTSATRPEPQAGVKSYPVTASHVPSVNPVETHAAKSGSRPVDVPTLTPAAKAYGEALAALEVKLDARAHAFDLFDVPLDADRPVIRDAWARLSKEYHPDALAGRGLSAFASRVTRIFAALSEASAELSDPARRDALRDAIASGRALTGESTTDVLRKSLEADRIAKDADRMLRAGAFAQALELFAQAQALSPDEPEFIAGGAWCAFQIDGRTPDAAMAARAVLAPLVASNPKSARAHYLLGMVLVAGGHDGLAIGSLQEAMKLDPRMVDAERQLRAIRLRISPPKNSPTGFESDVKNAAAGLFKGLFGGSTKK